MARFLLFVSSLTTLYALTGGQGTEIINGGDGPGMSPCEFRIIYVISIQRVSHAVCDVKTDDWSKDYKFASYRKEKGAAYANRAIRALDDIDDIIIVRRNVKNVRRCFKACVDTKNCGTFTYIPTAKECTLSSARALSSRETNNKNLAQFCKRKGSIAGFVGYEKGNEENKVEKETCVDPISTCTKQCCGSAAANCSIKSITCTSKGTQCEC